MAFRLKIDLGAPAWRGGPLARRLAATLSPDARLLLLIAALLAIRLLLYAMLAGGFGALPASLCHWDCNWYRDIAAAGYARQPKTVMDPSFGQANWAFLPVFPALIRGVYEAAPLSYVAAATVVSNAALCAFVFFAVKYLRLVRPAAGLGAGLAVFLFAFPASLYFSLPYTEAVYGALAMAAFWCLARGDMLATSGVAAVLSATRVTGVLLTPVIVFHYLGLIMRAWRGGGRRAALAGVSDALLPIALAPFGLFVFMLFLYLHTGDGLGFLHIQRAWGRTSQNPIWTIWLGLQAFDLSTFAPRLEQSQTLDALSALAGLLLAVRLLALRRYAEGWFLATAILIPLSHGLDSLPRYTLAQPIFMVFLFDLIWQSRCRAVFPEIITLCLVVQLVLVHLWMGGYAFLH